MTLNIIESPQNVNCVIINNGIYFLEKVILYSVTLSPPWWWTVLHSIFQYLNFSIFLTVKRRDLVMKYFPESSSRAAVKALDELKSLTGIRSTWLRNKWEPSWSISETHNPILLSTECSIQFLTDCSIQYATECPIQLATDCPVQLASECPVQLASDCSIIPQYDRKTQ